MGLPKVVYYPTGGPVTLQFKRGPVNFAVKQVARGNTNLATSGAAQERVLEAMDLLITFEMPHLVIDDDMAGWDAFLQQALAGATFNFFPNSSLTDWYNCVDESGTWDVAHNAPKKYASGFQWRVLNDAYRPSGPGVILRRFYGVTS